MKETIHYIADIQYVSHVSSDRYSSKRQVVEAHVRYIQRSATYEFGSKDLVIHNSEKYNKRVNSRVAGKTVFALPNDIKRDEYQKWCRYIQSVLAENFKVDPEYIYIAIHETHDLQEYLNTRNLHAHVVFNPVTRDGKAIQTKISDLKQLHNSWRQILVREGYTIRKDKDGSIGKLGWKLRKDEELLNSYKEYIESKREQQQAARLARSASLANTEIGIIADVEVIEDKKKNEPSPNYSQFNPSSPPRQPEPPRQPQPQPPTRQPEKPQPVKPEPQQQKEIKKKQIYLAIKDKNLVEVIATLRQLKKTEKDKEIIEYLDNLLKVAINKAEHLQKQNDKQKEQDIIQKAREYQNSIKNISEIKQEIKQTEKPVQQQPEPQRTEPKTTRQIEQIESRQPQPELPVQRQPQPQKPQPQPEKIAYEEEREKREKPVQPQPEITFSQKVRQFIVNMKNLEENADPQQLVSMLLRAETDKEEKILSELVARQTTRQARQPQPQPQKPQPQQQPQPQRQPKPEQKPSKDDVGIGFIGFGPKI